MRMLGIDPGLTATGWGVVSLDGQRLVPHAHGKVSTLVSNIQDVFGRDKP